MSELPRPASSPARELGDLLAGLPVPYRILGSGAVTVTGVTVDSRRVRAGDLYVALPGTVTHGARFAAAAVADGAVAVLTDPEGAGLIEQAKAGLSEQGKAGATGAGPVVVVDRPRRRMGDLAAELYGRPADALTMIGITGTNGKTTTAFCVEAALRSIGRHVGMIGTIGFHLDGVDLGGARTTVTTPESVDLHALLALMRERGADAVVMEVSSHALALDRVAGVRFDVAGFTNLGRDHLDFHGTMESYFAAKAALFEPERTRAAVIDVDDAYGVRLAAHVLESTGPVRLTTVSGGAAAADWRVLDRSLRPDGGYDVTVDSPAGLMPVRVGLPGAFNVLNAVTALALVGAVGVDPAGAVPALADAQVPGRMQRVLLGTDAPIVVVDFAHTPQAVAAALDALGDQVRASGGRLVAVLGCGGERDPLKRQPMGAAAAGRADVVVVTDDNPRGEDPAAIRAEVLAGARHAEGRRAELIIDGGGRRDAIHTALADAGSSDVVAVLGKGHEQGQEVARPDGTAVILPFDDALVIGEEWVRLAEGALTGPPDVEPDSATGRRRR